MPLPTALEARLQKRGLLQTRAEVYQSKETHQSETLCPNAWNSHHTCVEFCVKHWGSTSQSQSSVKEKSKGPGPLPPGWFLVPDPGKSHHSYYWNVNTNLVSWLHPQHPKAEITYPASSQKQEESDEESLPIIEIEGKQDEIKAVRKVQPKIKTGKHPSLLKAQRQKERSAPYQKSNTEGLDPMDPAAYSDVPRGTWTSGLKEDGDVKTGVDTTANGPLFQQRPYPSPGEVLRRNKQHTKN